MEDLLANVVSILLEQGGRMQLMAAEGEVVVRGRIIFRILQRYIQSSHRWSITSRPGGQAHKGSQGFVQKLVRLALARHNLMKLLNGFDQLKA